ncbi:MAG: biotin/lipoyl-binding protein, partial [Planctomycetota bacterium]
MKHVGSWTGGLVLFAAGLASGWAARTLVHGAPAVARESEDDEEAPAIDVDPASMRLSVTTAEASSGELPITLAVSGRFRAAPAAERSLSSRAGGRVLEILAAPGQAVKHGEVLLRLDPATAEAALGVARAGLAESLNRQTEFERTGSVRLAVELKVAAERASAQVSLLEAQVARLAPLLADGLVSDKAFGEAQQALDSARAEQTLSHSAQNAFASSGESLQRATLVAARDSAELAAREAEKALAEVEVRAPSDGQVVEWIVRGGEVLGAGATLGRWLSAAGRELALQVPASKSGEVSVGLPITWVD